MASVLTLFFILMYIFAVLGFCLFGGPEGGPGWENLAVAFFTLFSLATVRSLGTAVVGSLSRGCQLVWVCGHVGPPMGPSPRSDTLLGQGN